MKRLLSILLCVCLLLSLTACGEQTLDPAEAKRIVIWHDKEDAVIAALELLSGIAAMIKPVDDLLGMNLVIAVIMFVQSAGFLLKAVYCKHIIK